VTDADQLAVGARALDVELDSRQIAQLALFADLLRRWNTAFNLVSRRDVRRLIARHVLDSLSLVPRLKGHRVLDLGTGAGLPGVPLAIARPALRFVLVDRSERRIRFVQQACIEIGLTNVEAVADDFAHFRSTTAFDTVVSRAVAKPAVLWRFASALLTPDGVALLQVGGAEHVPVATDTTARVEPIRIPGIEQPQHVMTIRRRNSPSQEVR
jgi:16S rRNA (guanine527-N7)-methyltransferase